MTEKMKPERQTFSIQVFTCPECGSRMVYIEGYGFSCSFCAKQVLESLRF